MPKPKITHEKKSKTSDTDLFAGETGVAVQAGSTPSAGTGHGGAAPSGSGTGGSEANISTQAVHNPAYPQGKKIPVKIPQPSTVPFHPWQLPPGSAIPI